MSGLADRRLLIGLGGLAAVGLGAAVAIGLTRGDRSEPAPPPAAEGGLQVEVGENARASLDPAKPLRCFVDGEFVGMQTLSACARKNGVAAQSLDVGLDETGAVAAAVDQPLAPLPPPVDVAEAPPAAAPLPPAPEIGPAATSGQPQGGAAFSECMGYGRYGWSVVSQSAPLGVCVNLLFDGRCEQPGGAQYGRWGEQTVRLVPGKVEIAEDGRTFRTLAEQGPNCAIPRI